MVKIAVDRRDIVRTHDTKEKILAVRRKISISKKNVVSVSTEKAKPSRLSFKMGTHVPMGFIAETLWTRMGKAFYYVRDFTKCVTLHLMDHPYSKVVVEVDDKESIAKELERRSNYSM